MLLYGQARDIQLANPTRRVLSYAARLEGSSDFSFEASVVKIDPGRSIQVCWAPIMHIFGRILLGRILLCVNNVDHFIPHCKR